MLICFLESIKIFLFFKFIGVFWCLIGILNLDFMFLVIVSKFIWISLLVIGFFWYF